VFHKTNGGTLFIAIIFVITHFFVFTLLFIDMHKDISTPSSLLLRLNFCRLKEKHPYPFLYLTVKTNSGDITIRVILFFSPLYVSFLASFFELGNMSQLVDGLRFVV
jgi:hypothetical protein